MAITTPYAFTTGDDATATRLNTRSSAVAELQSPPRCRAWQNAAQSIPNTTATAVLLDTEDIDTEAIHSTAVNTSRMTIVTAGRYRCIGQVAWANNATGYRGIQLWKTGAQRAFQRQQAVAAGVGNITQITEEILCTPGDYIELFAEQTSGGALNLLAGTSALTFLHVVWCSLI